MPLPQVIFLGVNLIQFTVDFANFFALYLAISLTLNLEFGSTGIPNFGKVLFIAGGAAVAGSVSGRLAAYVFGVNTHGDFITFNALVITQVNTLLASSPLFAVELVLLALVIAAVIGAVFGYISSYPAIHLREDYLGMLLLAVAQFFQIFLRAWGPLVGGTQGIFVPDPFSYFATLGPGYRDVAAAVVMGVFCIAVYIYAEKVVRSPLGRMLRAVRDNEDAARALGKNDVAVRRNILIAASAISGMAGALVTFYSGAVGADTWTRYAWTFWPWLIVIIGGASNNVGVALGAFFFAALNQGLNQVRPALQPFIPFDANWLTYIIFGGLLIVMLLVRPQGIIPEKPTPTVPKGVLTSMASKAGPEGGAGQTSQGGAPIRQLKRVASLLRRPPGADG